jgi:hypothetical protein
LLPGLGCALLEPRTRRLHGHRQPDGDVKVTIRQLSDAKGVAAALRADGVPAYVGFSVVRGGKYCPLS